MILFLDFDGVLHPDAVFRPRNKPLELRAEGSLLMHAQVLESIFDSYGLPDESHIEIVLSTSWVRELGYERTIRKIKKLIPESSLVDRIVGATWSKHMRHGGNDPFNYWTRFEQIQSHVKRHGIKHWLAIDDLHSGEEDWPDDMQQHLVQTEPMRGLGSADVQEELKAKLHKTWLVEQVELSSGTFY